MPIKPENKARYPKNWPEVRERIRKRAGDKCEGCGVKNYAVGARDINGEWHDENDIENMNSTVGEMLFGEFPKMIKIVCTTAHLDHTPENCSDDNLRFWCQKCHNNYDKPHRKRTYKSTRNKGQFEFTFSEALKTLNEE